MSINIKPSTISDLLNNSDLNKLIIPPYQRPYSWTNEKEVNIFLQDFFNINANYTKTKRHFIGLIVLCPHGEDKDKNKFEYDIIDGQQRITTISILIAVLRDILMDYQKHDEITKDAVISENVNDFIVTLNSCLKKTNTPIGHELILNTETEGSDFESDFLNVILNKFTALESKYVDDYNNQDLNNKNSFIIKENYLMSNKFNNQYKKKNSFLTYKKINEEIIKKISNLTKYKDKCNELIMLSSCAIHNLTLMPFLSENPQEAFLLFETLNDRGLELAAIDLIKNLCLRKVEKDTERKKVHKLWKTIFTNTLESKDSSTFMRYVYNSKYGFARKNDLYNKFDDTLKEFSSTKELIEFLEELLRDAENIKILKNTNTSSQIIDNKFANTFNLLRSTKSIQWYSIGLSILRIWDLFNNDPQKNKLINPMVNVLESVHLITMGMIIKSGNPNTIESFFPKISKELGNNSKMKKINEINKILIDINKQIRDKIISENLVLNFNDIQTYDTEKNDNSKLLLTYLRYKKTKDGNLNSDNMTLEHVYPLNPRINEWKEFEKLSKSDQNKYRYKIGNHILLTSKPNKELQNSSYENKKGKYKIYNPEEVVDDIKLSIQKNKKWTIDLIDKRTINIHKQLANYLEIIPK